MGYEPYSCKRVVPDLDEDTNEARESLRAEMQRILQMPMSEFVDYYAEIQEQMESTDLLMEQGVLQL